MHPYQATIDLLRTLVRRLPPKFPRVLGSCLQARIEILAADSGIGREALDDAAVEIGRHLWHFRHAWEEVFARVGEPIVREHFLVQLPNALRAQVLSDVGPGVPQSIFRLSVFESYTPEDRLVLEEALLAATKAATDELTRRIEGGAMPDYDASVLRWEGERIAMEQSILDLRALAREKPEWAGEILGLVREYELGFTGILGREPTRSELDGVIADWRGRQ